MLNRALTVGAVLRRACSHAVLTLQDGSVLVIGGIATSSPAASWERHYPRYSVPIDRDLDRVVDVLDTCPDDADADQLHSDRDGIGDACDPIH